MEGFIVAAKVLVALAVGYLGVVFIKTAWKSPENEATGFYGFVGGLLLILAAVLFGYTIL